LVIFYIIVVFQKELMRKGNVDESQVSSNH
jgi:hypothetical protein